jgi:hypothetical protein
MFILKIREGGVHSYVQRVPIPISPMPEAYLKRGTQEEEEA